MNHSMYGADRATHVRVVVLGLMAAITMATFGLSLHLYAKDAPTETVATLKVGKSLQVGSATLTFSR